MCWAFPLAVYADDMCPCRFILHAKKTAFIVEHDFIMATSGAESIVRSLRSRVH